MKYKQNIVKWSVNILWTLPKVFITVKSKAERLLYFLLLKSLQNLIKYE